MGKRAIGRFNGNGIRASKHTNCKKQKSGSRESSELAILCGTNGNVLSLIRFAVLVGQLYFVLPQWVQAAIPFVLGNLESRLYLHLNPAHHRPSGSPWPFAPSLF